MHSWNRSCTGWSPRPGTVPAARYSMHCTGQNSGHLPHGQQRFTSMNATSRGRFFFTPTSSGMSGTRSSLRRWRMTSLAGGMRDATRSSSGEPVRDCERDADQPADDRAVQADELEVGPDARLDLRDELVGLELLEHLPDRVADLVVL